MYRSPEHRAEVAERAVRDWCERYARLEEKFQQIAASDSNRALRTRIAQLEALAEHLRMCGVCGLGDVTECERDGMVLFNAAFPDAAESVEWREERSP
jgi:hypothetical protein